MVVLSAIIASKHQILLLPQTPHFVSPSSNANKPRVVVKPTVPWSHPPKAENFGDEEVLQRGSRESVERWTDFAGKSCYQFLPSRVTQSRCMHELDDRSEVEGNLSQRTDAVASHPHDKAVSYQIQSRGTVVQVSPSSGYASIPDDAKIKKYLKQQLSSQ